jgi:hypothetical protein
VKKIIFTILLIAIAAFVTTGFAEQKRLSQTEIDTGIVFLDKATINGKKVYVGESQEELRKDLGTPLGATPGHDDKEEMLLMFDDNYIVKIKSKVVKKIIITADKFEKLKLEREEVKETKGKPSSSK